MTKFIPKRACEGAATIDHGNMQECPHPDCTVSVAHDLVDHPFFGFKAGCPLNQKRRTESATPDPASDPVGELAKLTPDHARIQALEASLQALTRAKEEAEQEAQHLRTELLYLAHREYDDNPGAAFDNRRKLARAIARHLEVTEAEANAMNAAAADHAGTGGEIIAWLVNHLRRERDAALQENARLKDDRRRQQESCVLHLTEAGRVEGQLTTLRAEIDAVVQEWRSRAANTSIRYDRRETYQQCADRLAVLGGTRPETAQKGPIHGPLCPRDCPCGHGRGPTISEASGCVDDQPEAQG